MEQHDDTTANAYPLGRGYGHDYMRGGEVLGGYGYSARKEYERPRGADEESDSTGSEAEGSEEDATPELSGGPGDDAAALAGAAPSASDTPVPQIEHAFGIGGPIRHSRSFYITQAQLQQRVYLPPERSGTELPRHDES
ncbi:MAG TPA: hypothetical protein VFK13_01275 [Gemmatimonadaceae bacterium]|nr:hypothetical protein [Gemmatimonadaceae bacterium]